VNPYSLYVPEFAPGGQRQPLDAAGRSRFRDFMKTPGMSNPNKGKVFDYVPEGTVSLLEEEARLQRYAEQTKRALDSGMLSLKEKVQAQAALADADGRISAIRGVVMEIDPDPGELAMSQFQRYEVPKAREATNMTRFDLDKEYRKMAADEFTSKIEQGLDNARRYLDQSEIARELMTKRPKVPASVGRTAKMAAGVLGIVPEPTDLALLALAGPAEMMFGTGIGEEPETGTFGIPLETTLQNASRIIDQPLDSRHINVDTRIRLADQDYAMASQLHSDGVLSREAFDIITRIRRARGGDTTVMPLARPEVPDTEPAIGLPGRRL